MTRDRKLLIITGSALIALIIAIAAFSLGVYVGVHGWTAGAPAVAGPGGRPPRPPDPGVAPPDGPDPQAVDAPAQLPPRGGPGQPGPGQPGPRPQLVGQVRTVSGETITLDTPQGPRVFQVGQYVQVFRATEGRAEPASLEEIAPGDHLAVFGRIEGDGAKQLIAMQLVLLPPPPEKQP